MQNNKYIIDPDKSWMNIENINQQELKKQADEERGGMMLVAYIFLINALLLLGTGIFLLCKFL